MLRVLPASLRFLGFCNAADEAKRVSERVEVTVAVAFSSFEPVAESQEFIPQPARFCPVDRVAEVADQLLDRSESGSQP